MVTYRMDPCESVESAVDQRVVGPLFMHENRGVDPSIDGRQGATREDQNRRNRQRYQTRN